MWHTIEYGHVPHVLHIQMPIDLELPHIQVATPNSLALPVMLTGRGVHASLSPL